MLITSHLVVTLLASRGLSLEGLELWAALAGGMALDVDHLFVSTKWTSDIKNFLQEGKITHGEIKQHSWIQEPLLGLPAGVISGVISSFFIPSVRWWIFPVFQALHIVTDALMNYEHQPFVPISRWKYWGVLRSNTSVEWFVSSALLLAAILI